MSRGCFVEMYSSQKHRRKCREMRGESGERSSYQKKAPRKTVRSPADGRGRILGGVPARTIRGCGPGGGISKGGRGGGNICADVGAGADEGGGGG